MTTGIKAGLIPALVLMGALSATASATDFIATKPTPRVEYWQDRYNKIDAAVADVKSLPAVKLLFVGDSITDFWLLDDNPWMPEKKCGRLVWDESFQQPGSRNFALNIGVSGDRTEHLLYRLLPKAQGGMGQIDAPQLAPEYIVLMIGINNSWAAEEPAADSMFEGARAVILALHARKPGVPIILQSLLPINDDPKDSKLVQPVNKRLRALAASESFKGYVTFLDLYPSFVDSSGKQISRYFNDGIHPSLEGYRVWRDQLVPFLEKTRAAQHPSRPDAGMAPPRSAGRLRPPATLTCDINHVTSWSGEVTGYRRSATSTWLQISTDEDTVEQTTIEHAGQADASSHYLLWQEPFTAKDWPKIEKKKGVLIKGMRAVAWICDDGTTAPVIDWQPKQD